MAIFNSNLVQIIEIHRSIGKRAVREAAIVVQNKAKKEAQGGFKSGRFVTNGWTTIGHRVRTAGLKVWGEVGSPLKHFAYWE